MKTLLMALFMLVALTNVQSQDVSKLLIEYDTDVVYHGKYNWSNMNYDYDEMKNIDNNIKLFISSDNVFILYKNDKYIVTNVDYMESVTFFYCTDGVKFGVSMIYIEKYTKLKNDFYTKIELNKIDTEYKYFDNDAINRIRTLKL